MQKLIRFEPSKCIACKMCELACSFKHFSEFAPSKARIVNEAFLEEAAYITVTCLQCEDPWCMKACPTGAITKNPLTGLVTINEDKCVGCRACVAACPFGMIKFADWKGKADKCDLCYPDFPECVAFCPTGALTYSEEDVPLRGKVKKFVQAVKAGELEV